MKEGPSEIVSEHEIGILPILQDIIHDRTETAKNLVGSGPDYSWIREFGPEQRAAAFENISLLHKLNGHRGADLRRLVSAGTTQEAAFLNNLLRWSELFAAGEHPDPSAVVETMPAGMSGLSDAALYERIAFLEKHPDSPRENISALIQAETAAALGISSEKWIDLIDPVFNDPKSVGKIIARVGFIPEDLYTKKKFKSVDPKRIIGVTEELRRLEGGDISRQALRERARAINQLFISRRAEPIRAKEGRNIELDSNGLSINLAGLHSHIPYGLIDDEMLSELQRGNWLEEGAILEAALRKAESNNQQSATAELKEFQVMRFSEDIRLNRMNFFHQLKAGEGISIAERIISGNLVIPSSWIESAQSKDDLVALVGLAEQITGCIGEEPLGPKPEGLSEYSLGDATDEAYRVQSAILNGPQYYNVTKVMQHFLAATPPSSAEEEYAVFRGQYKKSREGDQHSFVEVIHEGKTARVLINEKKHASLRLRDSLNALPLFDRATYENLDAALLTFNSFSASLNRLAGAIASNGSLFRTGQGEAEAVFSESAENCLHFLLNNVSERYTEAAIQFELLKQGGPLNPALAENLVGIFSKARQEYSDFMYRNILSQTSFEENFSPEIQVRDVQFGEEFLQGAAEKGVSGYDEELCRSDFSTRVVSIDYRLDDPSGTIPFHIEESCLDALRMNRDRPLINVIGGCKHLDAEQNPLELFSEAVVNAAHKHRANVGVPGTQSGIGTVFGRENVNYGTRFSHLPHAEKAHFFSINPGGSVYFPGNALIDKQVGSVYANTAVDTLVTPVPAEWNKKGLDKYNSKYITHIAYMEAIYARMTVGQKHLMVVGNGGLYSIMEVNESLKNGARLVLVSNTGRFAEAASALLPSVGEVLSSQNPASVILEKLRESMDGKSFEEFIKKDFGAGEVPDNDDFVVYRDYFVKFLKLAQGNAEKIAYVELDSLELTLDALMSSRGN